MRQMGSMARNLVCYIVDDGCRLPTFTLALRGGVEGRSCIDGSAVKMLQMRGILALKESEVLFSS